MCEFQKTGHQKEVVLNLYEIFFSPEEKCTHMHCLYVSAGPLMVKELRVHPYVPVSPVLLNLELIVQVQAICQEGIEKDPESNDFVQLT